MRRSYVYNQWRYNIINSFHVCRKRPCVAHYSRGQCSSVVVCPIQGVARSLDVAPVIDVWALTVKLTPQFVNILVITVPI